MCDKHLLASLPSGSLTVPNISPNSSQHSNVPPPTLLPESTSVSLFTPDLSSPSNSQPTYMTPSSSVKLSSPEFSSEQKVQPHSSALVPHGSHSSMPVNKLSATPSSSPLPFPKVSNSWYHHRGELAGANEAREQFRKQTQPTLLDGVLLSLYRSRVTGTLEENLAFLLKKKENSGSWKL